MILGILAAVLPILMKLLGMAINRSEGNEEAERKFLELAAAIQRLPNLSVKLNKDYEAQLKELRMKDESKPKES